MGKTQMTTTIRFAPGASTYTQAGYLPTGPLDEQGLFTERADGPARTWSDVIDELLALRGLEDDWDGQGAVAPDAALVDTALAVALDFRATTLPPADRAVAGVNGTVFFEWFSTTKYLEIEVTAPGQAEGRLVFRESNTTEVFTLAR
jgi:hypothetical protein